MLIAAPDLPPFATAGDAPFAPQYWQNGGAPCAAPRGRGSAWFIQAPDGAWVLRQYLRGGWLAAQLPLDRYLWMGEERVRSFMEWRLLQELRRRSLPVPEPIGAHYRRGRLTYSCSLITRRIDGASPLSDLLSAGRLAPELWRSLGTTIARFHAAGVDHADLNAHNILVTADGSVSIIDFDRCRQRPLGSWREGNLHRLRRSLRKVCTSLPSGRFTAPDWDALLSGYAAGRAVAANPAAGAFTGQS
jgi:3-deoxy-D-manno-octulosonic acid kinase